MHLCYAMNNMSKWAYDRQLNDDGNPFTNLYIPFIHVIRIACSNNSLRHHKFFTIYLNVFAVFKVNNITSIIAYKREREKAYDENGVNRKEEKSKKISMNS